MTKDLKGQKLPTCSSNRRWKTSTKRVDLTELCKLVKLDDIEKRKLPDSGADNVGFDLTKVEGLPAEASVRQADFRVQEGARSCRTATRNMCTGFIILKGEWHGRHFEPRRDESGPLRHQADHRQELQTGRLSTISDHKDNSTGSKR